MGTAIQTRALRKTFGSTVALDGLDLTVEEGEVHGFLGPNGAGKSTTIRILLGLLRADGGSATVLGADPWADAAQLHRRIAYVPGDVALWPNLTGGEVIDLISRLRGGLNERRRADLLERLDLDPTMKCRAYSKGNRQKVALVAALASDTPLLLLDEPTAGLDPLMDQVFRTTLRELRAEGRTVLLSSHILSEVENLSDHVTIIRAGKAVQTGALSDMRHLSRTVLDAQVSSPAGISDDLSAIPDVEDLLVEGGRVRCSVEPAGLSQTLAVLGRHGLTSLVSRPPSLEDLFLRLYQGGQERTPLAQAQP
ncbi:ABC transporter ATP-binding protein [Knoellia sp. p5-6-4]|uniref:ABC transporter ATP-binding protein n=1 Tax=unclassified Knoellia TaxID=2618719 RepID=UPI0023DAAA16|nr:ABC transporter ATP-binding protein [Knoellia sp. p5-6-4]MDF2146565.1 ABC transporter ATP-binding protein [Knoellia sp. p5-6-4]